MKNIAIVTLGCAKNTNDTENLGGLLKKKGYGLEKDPSKADAVVVHTCSFIEAAKKESVETILETAKAKKSGAKLYVTGCMVQQHGKELMEEIPEAEAFLGTGQLNQIPTLLKTPKPRFLDRRNPGGLTDPDAQRLVSTKGASAYVRLSEGCSHPCSFCVIPRLRGGLQSRPEEKIVAEVTALAQQGIQEVVLIGQDTGEWGQDLYGEKTLPRLLRQLQNVKGLRWVRVMYMHPSSMTDELISVLADNPDLFPYLDMPIQHIDDHLLKDMKRHLPEAELRTLLEKIRQGLPHISLRTTFIVGYPGETDKQFNKLNDVVNDGIFDYLGAFTYSHEEGTPAYNKEDQLPATVKEERHAALMATYYNVAYQKAQKRLGTTETILIESTEGDTVVGRTKNEAPEIDAQVRLPRQAARQGAFIQATLKSYDTFEYEGLVR